MADALGELDPAVARLRRCIEEGKEIHVEGDGFRIGDEPDVIPKVCTREEGDGNMRLLGHAVQHLLDCGVGLEPSPLLAAATVVSPCLRYLVPAARSLILHPSCVDRNAHREKTVQGESARREYRWLQETRTPRKNKP